MLSRVLKLLVLSVFIAAGLRNCGGNTASKQDASAIILPPLANLSSKRQRAFERQFSQQLEADTFEGDPGTRSEIILPLPLRGPVGSCEGKEIYVLDDSEIKFRAPNGDTEGDHDNTGSAGMPLWIFASEPGSMTFSRVFEESVINFEGVVHSPSGRICPTFRAVVHGIHFGQAGNLYGTKFIFYSSLAGKYNFQ